MDCVGIDSLISFSDWPGTSGPNGPGLSLVSALDVPSDRVTRAWLAGSLMMGRRRKGGGYFLPNDIVVEEMGVGLDSGSGWLGLVCFVQKKNEEEENRKEMIKMLPFHHL